MIDLMMMAYAGLRNKRLVELCQIHGINALGLSGIDGRLIEGERNSAIRVRENGKTLIVRDNSGKPKAVNTSLLQLLLGAGYTPVISVPIIDADGRAINTDNDDVVALLHRSLNASTILQFIEAPGLLSDRANPESLVSRIEKETLPSWEERVQGRMRRKIMGIRKLFESGSPRVILADGRGAHPIEDALAGRGTTIQ
jgi:acetylglutamate/LysW-gamma-L-alpha-aminoadipate kinase